MPSISLHNFTELKKSPGHSSLALLTITLVSVVGMSFYIFFRQIFPADLPVWESNIVTIVFGSLVSTVIAYFVMQRNRILQKRAAAETVERQWTEEALIESEARYRQLFESNPQPMWVYDLHTYEFLAVNDAAVRHYGYSHEEFAKMTIRNVSLPKENAVSNHVSIKSLSPGYHTPRIWRHRKKNGTLIDVEMSSHTLEFSGRRAGLVLVHDVTEVKRVERVLIESEAELRVIFGAMNDIILVFDRNGKYLKIAPTAAKARYKSPQELLGKTVTEIFPQEQADFFLRNIQLALDEKTMREVEYKLQIGEKAVWFEGRVSPITNDTVFWISRDITERKKAEEQLNVQKELLRNVIDTIPSLIYVKDIEGTFTLANQAIANTYGTTVENLIGKTDADFNPHWDEVEQFWREDVKLLESGQERFIPEEKITDENGHSRWLQTAKRPFVLPYSSELHVLGICTDISERKQIEERLRDSEERYRELFENATDLVYTIDLKGNFTSLNKAGERLTGYLPEEVPLMNFTQVVAPEYLEIARQNMMKKVSGEATTVVYELEILAKDGRRIPLETSTRIIEIEGKPVGIQGISRDITERKQFEEQLRQAQKLESVGQMAAGIAHEINTPLQYVGDNTRFLQDAFNDLNLALAKQQELFVACQAGTVNPNLLAEVEKTLDASDVEYLSEEIPSALKQSLEGIERVTRIVQSMKDFAHPGSTEMKAVNLNKSIESTITVASNEWKYIADLETNFDENLPPIVCIGGEINQVILNLIINAVHTIADVVGDGSGGKGKIAVQTRWCGTMAEIRISDSGRGIPPEIRDKIFNPFFTTKEVGKGTGQGLAISHRVICNHGGTLQFETELGSGTTFIIRLPISGVHADPSPMPDVEMAEAATASSSSNLIQVQAGNADIHQSEELL